jgi:hypothetical protein
LVFWPTRTMTADEFLSARAADFLRSSRSAHDRSWCPSHESPEIENQCFLRRSSLSSGRKPICPRRRRKSRRKDRCEPCCVFTRVKSTGADTGANLWSPEILSDDVPSEQTSSVLLFRSAQTTAPLGPCRSATYVGSHVLALVLIASSTSTQNSEFGGIDDCRWPAALSDASRYALPDDPSSSAKRGSRVRASASLI